MLLLQVNRLNRTKEEKYPNLAELYHERELETRAEQKATKRSAKEQELLAKREREEQRKLQSYE